jgi:hypothetical protein
MLWCWLSEWVPCRLVHVILGQVILGRFFAGAVWLGILMYTVGYLIIYDGGREDQLPHRQRAEATAVLLQRMQFLYQESHQAAPMIAHAPYLSISCTAVLLQPPETPLLIIWRLCKRAFGSHGILRPL